MFKDILLAITPSELCDCAADAAFHFAQRFESRLVLLHVCGMRQGWGEMEFLDPREKSRASRPRWGLLQGKRRAQHYEVKVDPACPMRRICASPQDEFRLIVMGPHTKESPRCAAHVGA